jgi:hypothetical protein
VTVNITNIADIADIVGTADIVKVLVFGNLMSNIY